MKRNPATRTMVQRRMSLESAALMRAAIVIPARWASSRFPGKPLALIAGVSLIQRVYERSVHSRRASTVYVATDDDRIGEHVASFGGRVVKPDGDFQSGTDRIAASLDLLDQPYDIVVNVQGDEPMIDIGSVDTIIDVLARSAFDMATLACQTGADAAVHTRDEVKVVGDRGG